MPAKKQSRPDPSKPPVESAPVLTMEQVEKLQRGNVLNMGRKVLAGKTLTKGELAILRDAAGEIGMKEETPTFTRTATDLAQVLGVDRNTILRWLKVEGNPGRRSDGRYPVTEWLEFRNRRHGVSEHDGMNKGELQCKNLLLHNQRLEFNLAVLRGEYLSASEVERLGGDLGVDVGKVVSTIHLAAPSVVGVSVAEAEARLKEVEDEIMRQLNALPERIERLRKHARTTSGV